MPLSNVASTIAESVRAHLAGLSYGQTVNVVRAYVPAAEASTLNTLRITVTPAGMGMAATGRVSLADLTPIVGIGIQKKITAFADPGGATANAEIDALMLVTEQVADAMLHNKFSAAACTATDIDYSLVGPHLYEHNVFTATITATFTLTERR